MILLKCNILYCFSIFYRILNKLIVYNSLKWYKNYFGENVVNISLIYGNKYRWKKASYTLGGKNGTIFD